MKSVIAQGASIAKAIEEALKKADMPQEFFVKILEDAQSGFLGFGSKKAKIALFFKDNVSSEKMVQGMFEKGSYAGLFNNPELKKQLDQQLKELGFEIKPRETVKQEVKPKVFKKEYQSNHTQASKLQIRPLVDKSKTQQASTVKTDSSLMVSDNNGQFENNQLHSKSGQNKHKRYYHYRRNRYNNKQNNLDQMNDSAGTNKLNSSDKDHE